MLSLNSMIKKDRTLGHQRRSGSEGRSARHRRLRRLGRTLGACLWPD